MSNEDWKALPTEPKDQPWVADPEEDRRAAGALIWLPIGLLVTIGLLVLIF